MLAYTIYIIGTRKFLPHEGKTNQHFQREAYKDARNYFLAKFASSSTTSSSNLVPSASSSSSSTSSSSNAPSLYNATAEVTSSSSSTPPLWSTPSSSVIDNESDDHLEISAPISNFLGCEKASYLHGHFYFNIYMEEEKVQLDEMWLKPVIQIGEVVAGDEKLYHYTAHHMNTKAVPQKKDVSSFFFVEFRAQNEREMIVFSN